MGPERLRAIDHELAAFRVSDRRLAKVTADAKELVQKLGGAIAAADSLGEAPVIAPRSMLPVRRKSEAPPPGRLPPRPKKSELPPPIEKPEAVAARKSDYPAPPTRRSERPPAPLEDVVPPPPVIARSELPPPPPRSERPPPRKPMEIPPEVFFESDPPIPPPAPLPEPATPSGLSVDDLFGDEATGTVPMSGPDPGLASLFDDDEPTASAAPEAGSLEAELEGPSAELGASAEPERRSFEPPSSDFELLVDEDIIVLEEEESSAAPPPTPQPPIPSAGEEPDPEDQGPKKGLLNRLFGRK